MNKRKLAAAVVSLALSGSILLTGTFAWRSISQEARNEIVRMVNPGGRLHDDFDGENKDVYAENFFHANEGGVPIFVRIRLDEYMEVGVDAGKAPVPGVARNATPLVPGSKIDDVTTWRTHLPGDPDPAVGDAADPFHAHWTWTLGGKTVYMPTFNKNKDSLKADINGTWEGTTAGDVIHFDDYHAYAVGETLTGDACYDNDENDVEDSGTVLIQETHEARETPEAVVVTMAAWKALGCPMGPYWVYDVDGWAYWAQAIPPGGATGLLLDGILAKTDGPSYYAINVVGQFVTAGDWGSPTGGEDGTGDGFYAQNAGAPPTGDALLLLKLAAGMEYTVSAAPKTPQEGETVTAGQGTSLELGATVQCAGTEVSGQQVTWTLEGAACPGTQLDENGVLTVAADEPAGTVLTATARAWTGDEGTLQVTVTAPPPPPPPDPAAP